MVCCCAFGCSNRQSAKLRTEHGISFYRFPDGTKSPKQHREWLVKLRRKSFTPTKYTRLCSVHFEDSCFIVTNDTRRLQANAVPTKFNFPPRLQKTDKKRKPPLQRTVPVTVASSSMSASECGPSSRMSAPEYGPSSSMSAPDCGPFSSMSAPDCGPSSSMSAPDCGPFSSRSAPDCGPSSSMSAPDCGPFSRMSATECGPSSRMSAPDCGPSSSMSATECGPFSRMSATECGPSSSMSAPDCGPSSDEHPSVTVIHDHPYDVRKSPSELKRQLDDALQVVSKYKKKLKVSQRKTSRLKQKVDSLISVVASLKENLAR